jgi:hypothetical protein
MEVDAHGVRPFHLRKTQLTPSKLGWSSPCVENPTFAKKMIQLVKEYLVGG